MHFTSQHDEQINKKIHEDLNLITHEVLAVLGQDVHSILLCGGFGRGEGSVQVQNSGVRVVNDYDIIVVLKERNQLRYTVTYRYHDGLKGLAERLARQLGVKQVDLSLKCRTYFDSNSPLKIENYEVLRGHVVLYGKEDPCAVMPDWKSEDISLFEGTWLFRNRGAGLLIAAKYFLGRDKVPTANRENFVIECGKAELAMGDSVLLLKKKYHHLYRERLKRLSGLDVSDIPRGVEILEHYHDALEQKLQPHFEKYCSQNLVAWWYETVELFNIFFHFFEEKRLGSVFEDWLAYCELGKPEDVLDTRMFWSTMLRARINTFSPKMIRRILLKSRRSRLIELMALLLFAVQRNAFNQQYLNKAEEMLKVGLSGDPLVNWHALTNAFLLAIHPTGEARRVAERSTSLGD